MVYWLSGILADLNLPLQLRSFVATSELVKVDSFASFRDALSHIVGHPVTKR